MIMWGNLAGDLWPIPENPAPLWIRIPIGLVFIIISVYFLKSSKTNEALANVVWMVRQAHHELQYVYDFNPTSARPELVEGHFVTFARGAHANAFFSSFGLLPSLLNAYYFFTLRPVFLKSDSFPVFFAFFAFSRGQNILTLISL